MNSIARRLAGFSRLVALAAALCFAGNGCQSPPNSGSGATSSGGEPFDEHTSGRALVEAALKEAQADDKKVVLLFGANWCPYCRQLHALLETDPDLRALVAKSFVVVPLDVGTSSRNRNVSLIDRYEATVFTEGVPSVVVLDANGRRVAPTPDNPWSSKNKIEKERVTNFLTRAERMLGP